MTAQGAQFRRSRNNHSVAAQDSVSGSLDSVSGSHDEESLQQMLELQVVLESPFHTCSAQSCHLQVHTSYSRAVSAQECLKVCKAWQEH